MGIAFLIMLLFNGLICLNMNMAFLAFLVISSVLSIIILNIKLKEKNITKKTRIITIITVVICAILAVYIIKPIYGFSAIFAVMILYKFIDKIDFQKIDSEFIKGFVIYYIIPLIVALAISRLCCNGIYEASALFSSWMVNYFYFALTIVFEKIIVDIIIVMLVLAYKDILNSKIKANINSKLIYILSIILTIVICGTKVLLTIINIGVVDDRTMKLSIAAYENDLQEYYKLDFNPDLDLQNNTIYEEQSYYMYSFNDILLKGFWKSAELFYKTGTVSIKENVNNRSMSKKEAVEIYKERSEAYIEILNIYKEDLNMQVTFYILFYLSSIICITIIYKKMRNRS